MEIRELETFVKVVSLGSFTKAADELALSQPAATRQIASLERELKTKLLDRLGKKVSLTSSGEILHEYAVQILRLSGEAKEAVAETSGGGSGRLALGASSTAATYLLPPLLRKYRKMRPGVELSVRTGPSRKVSEMVIANTVDFGVVMETPTENSLLESTVLAEYSYTAIVYPNHPLAAMAPQEPIDAEALAGERIVTMEPGTTLRSVVDKLFSSRNAAPQIAMELDNVESIKKMVQARLGVSILPIVSVRDEISNGHLVTIPLADTKVSRQQIAAVYRKDKFFNAAMKELLGLLKAELGER
jgi:DNA-binding transcriptional LysR family regulator